MTLLPSMSPDRIALALVAVVALVALLYAAKCRADLASAIGSGAIARAQDTSKGNL